ncbi:MAG: glycosyltransferase family 2 protein [Rhizomicrobium sp.]
MPSEPLTHPRYSLVVPLYNEEQVLPQLIAALDVLLARMDAPAEVIFVDDGSRDHGVELATAKCRADNRYRLVCLSRNFGHQIAITAGMDRATGDAVIVMDADLQDPPEVVLELIAKWKEGYDVVYAQRRAREGESWFKRVSASMFYRLIARLSSVDIPRDTGDFRLIDRKVLEAFGQMREHDRFVRGMFAWMGFKQTSVTFDRRAREAGTTKYPLKKMIALAFNGIVGFSDAPLRLALWAGTAVSACAMLYGLYVVVLWISHDKSLVPGWSSTIVIVALLSGVNMLMTGLMGLYVGRIYNEVKGRPLYFVREENLPEALAAEETQFEPLAKLRRSFPPAPHERRSA